MLNVKLAQELLHNQMTTQGMTFNPSIDLRNDLVNFYGYSQKQVLNMSDDEVFAFFDNLDMEESGDHYNVLPIHCSECNHKGLEEREGYIDDYSCLHCPKCHHEAQVHYTGMDAIYEGLGMYED